MASRIIIRLSLNGDAGSRVRNAIATELASAGIVNTNTGTYEATGLDLANAVARLKAGLDQLVAGTTPGAGVELDHLWLYVDKA